METSAPVAHEAGRALAHRLRHHLTRVGLTANLWRGLGEGRPPSLTARPLVKAELATGVLSSTALAADTASLTIMEVIDNLVVVVLPGPMEAGVDDPLIYASIAAGFAVAYPFAFLANRYMIARGQGHALVDEHHAHEHDGH